MTALVALDEEEAAFYSILSDPSGLDLAEFAWYDPESDDGCYRAWDFQWCLTGDTVIYTAEGRRRLDDIAGRVRLLTSGGAERGQWVDAEVRSFGRAPVWHIELERRGVRRTLRATEMHRHFAGAGRARADRRTYAEKVTRDLRVGDYLQPATSPLVPLRINRNAVQAGIVFGDGTIAKERSLVRLDGGKRELAVWFDVRATDYLHHEAGVPAVQVRNLPPEYKLVMPEVTDPADVLWGWLAGYFATDGSMLPDGTAAVTSVDPAVMFRVRDIATALGIVVSAVGHREVASQPPGSSEPRTSVECRVVLRVSDLPEAFFLRAAHGERKRERGIGSRTRAIDAWHITSITPDASVEEVFCAVVPDTHTFVLDGDILTGNSWYTCDDPFQVDQGARATGKTVGVTMRAFAFPFNYEGQKMLLTAPELNHLRPLTDAIEQRFLTTRLMREMLPSGKGNGMNRQPHWQVRFVNGAMIISRLPNKDGKGVKGMHVLQLELDEAQDYPLAGWIEIVETLNRGLPGAAWRCHGVPKGVRDKFFEMTEGQTADDEIHWTVHRPMAMMRPTWSQQEREEKIRTYGGSRQNIDYKRNIYGEHGDAHSAVFVLARLMACVDTDEGSLYNADVYTSIRLEYERYPVEESARQTALLADLSVPGTHFNGYSQRIGTKEVGAPKGYSAYWGGADIGVTNHPSEFLIFGQRLGVDTLELLLRINLQRIPTDDHMLVIDWLFQTYGSKLKAFGIDKTGVGQPIWDMTHRRWYGERIYGYGFSEKHPCGFEDRPLKDKETKKDLVIMRNVVESSTDWLRNDYVDTARLRLPYDREVLLEFQGQTYMVVRDNGNPYGQRRVFGGGSFHTLDAAKMAVAGKHIPPIQAMLEEEKPPPPVLDIFLGG